MVETINLIVGVGIVILNLIPFIFRKSRYLILTALLSLMIILSLIFFK